MAKTLYPEGGLYVVENEVSLLMTTMRRGVRWSSHSHQDEDQDPMMKGLLGLKKVLHDAKNLQQLEPTIFLSPFLEIIRSEDTTGPVTSLALSAIHKIISYGLLDPEHPTIAQCIESIADTVTDAQFVLSDATTDGVVFMRTLQVLRVLMLSPVGVHLSNESICEILRSCFRICFINRLSELLRKTAEHCLKEMVQHLFSKLPHLSDDNKSVLNMKKMRTSGMDNSRGKHRKTKSSYSKPKSKASQDEPEENDDNLMSSVEKSRASVHLATTPLTPEEKIVHVHGSLDQNPCEENKCSSEIPKSDPVIVKTWSSDSVKEEQVIPETTEQEKIKDKEETEESSAKSDQQNDKFIGNEVQEPASKLENESEKNPSPMNSPMGSVEDLSTKKITENSISSKSKEAESPCEEYVNAQGVRFTTLQQHTPYGSLCIRELFQYLVSLCNPHNKKNTEIMIHLSLNLLQVAFEISADTIANFPSMLALIKDDLSRNIITLLGTDRLSILAANLQVTYLLFESQREHLKYQLELYIIKLMEIVNSDSNRMTYEQRELALEAIVRLWAIPGLAAELYVNYDCELYSTNLYEELMKLFSENLQNVSVLTGTMYSMQFISLDALLTFITGVEVRCKGYKDFCKTSRHESSKNLPTKDELVAQRKKKQLLVMGTDKFNENPGKGIAKLVELKLLADDSGNADPEKIAKFLVENPNLDKNAIGDYVSKKKNETILDCYAKCFDFKNTRLDQALRLYLEAFRLPGEAALITKVLEAFSAHWLESNNHPFTSPEAAFLLAYGIIMLNVDQHNHSAKKQITPMTVEDFIKNLKKVDADFDQEMLEEIYHSIKNDEIIMPAEQTGLVKENYLWKFLLRRGVGPRANFYKVGNSGEFIDKDLTTQAWAQIISAFCRAYDKVPDKSLQRKVAQAFLSCAGISAHYSMCNDLDTLIVSLCKFTGLAAGGDIDQVAVNLGESSKAQLAVRTLFKITHLYGDALRASWKNIIDCLQMLLKARLLPKNVTDGEDLLSPSGKVSLIRETTVPKASPAEQGIMSSLFSYITDATRLSPQAEENARRRAEECVANCNLKQIIEESKFLQVESLRSLVGALVSVAPSDEEVSVFLLEILLEVTIQNRDRVVCIWPVVQARLDGLLTIAARENQPFLLERVTVGMLRLAIRLLRGEEFASTVLAPLIPLTHLPSATSVPLARHIAYGLFQLLKTGAANIHTTEDWRVVFGLLECAGAGGLQPKPAASGSEDPSRISLNSRHSIMEQRSIPEWVLVSPTGTEAPLPVAADTIVLDRDLKPHDPVAFVKCCDSLTFLVRDVAHVTPFNFELCVRCVRTFAEAVLQCTGKRNSRIHVEELPQNYDPDCTLQLLLLMQTLHTNAAKVFGSWAEEENSLSQDVSLWLHAWKPLLQGIARLCCDSRRAIRPQAVTCLQTTLLAHYLTQLSALEWSQCLEQVLFPLLAQLLGPVAPNDPIELEETRVRAATLLSKVFLHHLTPLLTLSEFLPLWLTVLDLLRAYLHADTNENLSEAVPETLKNMLLVMSSAGVLLPESNLWAPTWRAIDGFLPNLKNELFPLPPPPPPSPPSVEPQVISLVDQHEEVIEAVSVDVEMPVPVKESEENVEKQENPEVIAVDVQATLGSVEEETVQTRENAEEKIDSSVIIHYESDEKISKWTTQVQLAQQQYLEHLTQQQEIHQYHPNHLDAANICQEDSNEVSDPSKTTMFNSSMYFSEDPAADRLFVVTNP